MQKLSQPLVLNRTQFTISATVRYLEMDLNEKATTDFHKPTREKHYRSSLIRPKPTKRHVLIRLAATVCFAAMNFEE
jgi:hypothetical protein